MSDGVGVYLHMPYCPYKCHYCDFNAYRLPPRPGTLEAMAAGIVEEIARAPGDDRGRQARSIYFGGGTPSLFPPRAIAAILEALRRRYRVVPRAEVTLECNPGTVDVTVLQELSRAGVTRLSIGAQSFDAAMLRRLGRGHAPEDTRLAVRAARQAGFDNLNIDVIYGLPGTTAAEAERDAREALALGPEHLSAYALEVEDGTYFGALRARGTLPLPSDDEVVEAGEAVARACLQHGLERYEISNFARPGRRSRHNLLYWHQGDYRGFGPGAHSHMAGRRSWNVAGPGPYLKAVGAQGEACAGEETLSPDGRRGEWIYLRLRLTEGFSLRAFSSRFGVPLDAAYPGVRRQLVRQGLLEALPGRVRPTAAGRWLLHRVAEPFLP